MEDKTVFKCIRNVVAKYGCKILQLHVRSKLVQMQIKMRMIPQRMSVHAAQKTK